MRCQFIPKCCNVMLTSHPLIKFFENESAMNKVLLVSTFPYPVMRVDMLYVYVYRDKKNMWHLLVNNLYTYNAINVIDVFTRVRMKLRVDSELHRWISVSVLVVATRHYKSGFRQVLARPRWRVAGPEAGHTGEGAGLRPPSVDLHVTAMTGQCDCSR